MSLLTNLISYWKLDEASGTRVDSVGGNDLTDNNTVTQAAGKVGNAAQFTAANFEYLSRASNAALQTGDIDFTFAFGVHGQLERACLVWENRMTNEYYLYRDNARQLQFAVATGAGLYFPVHPPVSATAYHLVVCWHDATANTVNIQVDNGTVQSVTTGGNAPNVSTNPFYLGAYAGPSYYTSGRIDEFGFWKRTLTSQERTDLWNGGNGTSYPFSQSVSITGAGGVLASGAAITQRGAARTGTGGLQASGAATVKRGRVQTASGGLLLGGHGFWLVPLEYQIRLRAERRHHVLAAENRNRTPRFENRRAMAKESRS